MSRRHKAERREVNPDPKFNDLIVSKFMNSIMKEGKKSVAERIVYGAFDRIQKRTGQDPIRVFHEALTNVRPAVEVRSRGSRGSWSENFLCLTTTAFRPGRGIEPQPHATAYRLSREWAGYIRARLARSTPRHTGN